MPRHSRSTVDLGAPPRPGFGLGESNGNLTSASPTQPLEKAARHNSLSDDDQRSDDLDSRSAPPSTLRPSTMRPTAPRYQRSESMEIADAEDDRAMGGALRKAASGRFVAGEFTGPLDHQRPPTTDSERSRFDRQTHTTFRARPNAPPAPRPPAYRTSRHPVLSVSPSPPSAASTRRSEGSRERTHEGQHGALRLSRRRGAETGQEGRRASSSRRARSQVDGVEGGRGGHRASPSHGPRVPVRWGGRPRGVLIKRRRRRNRGPPSRWGATAAETPRYAGEASVCV